jgi:DNA primase
MRFPPSFLDEIKARLPVSSVVGKKVKLVKSGREWKGLSPFNAERTPSFFVNDQKQAWFDFSSGKNGNIFTFLMETEGISFPEAVERLAGEAGLDMPKERQADTEAEKARAGLMEICEMAAQFFEAQLRSPAGAAARAYLDKRGIGPDTRATFQLGFAPAERFALRDHLAGKGVEREAMIEAGLLVHGEDIAVPYDRFRDRVIFPISNARGAVIAFGGRAMAADVPAKYLNSPETPLFHKGSGLYNLHRARKAAHDLGGIIAVEGYVDVIALHMAGFPNAVAPLGTALTEEQLALLWRMADEPILCFDGDRAGRKAAYRAIDVALPHLAAGKSLRFALMPEGVDPDDLLRNEGRPAMEAVLAKALPLVDLLWTREIEAGSFDTPERRAGLENRLRELLGTIGDETIRRHYRDAMAERLSALFDRAPAPIGRNRLERRRGRQDWRGGGQDWRGGFARHGNSGPSAALLKASPGLASHPLFAPRPAISAREALILTLLVAHPAWIEAHSEDVSHMEFASRDAEDIRARIFDAMAHAAEGADLVESIAKIAKIEPFLRLRAAIRPGDAWALSPNADFLAVGDTLRQALTLHRRARTLNTELRAAERALAEGGDESTLAWLREIKAQLTDLEGAEADMDDIAALGAVLPPTPRGRA